MSLNIKNEEVHELVRRAARLTGKSQTSVVEEALRKYLDDLGVEPRRREADRLLAEMQAASRSLPVRKRMAIEDLYDPRTGLPT